MAATQGVYPATFDDPSADEWTAPFWQAALDGRLLVAACARCGQDHLPPRPRCFACRHGSFVWRELPGTGHVYSFTVIRHALAPYLTDVVPYVAAVVELDGTSGAGARLVANLIECDPDQVAIGDRVQVCFDTVSAELALPRVRPQPAPDGAQR